MTKHLFLGGIANGTWKEVDTIRDSYKVPIPIKVVWSNMVEPVITPYDYDIYRAVRIGVKDIGIQTVFVSQEFHSGAAGPMLADYLLLQFLKGKQYA